MATLLGTVQKLNRERGWGFIVSGDRSFFYHYASIVDGSWGAWVEGMPVTFEYIDEPKGPKAIRIRRAVLPVEDRDGLKA